MKRMKSNRVYYRVAGQIIEIEYGTGLVLDKCLPSFVSFLAQDYQNNENSIKIKLIAEAPPKDKTAKKLLSDKHISWQNRFRFEESDRFYITSIDGDLQTGGWKMYSTKKFDKSVIYMQMNEVYTNNILSWLIMVAFAQAGIWYDIILIHASVVLKGGKGYAFLGKSGTGKSTHSKLWIEHLPGVSLLNDDNPALKIYPDGTIHIYGTPWSGKTQCYKDMGGTLKAMVRLRQADGNRFKEIMGLDALLAVLPSCSAIRWNRVLFDKMVSHIEKVIADTLVAEMECLPNPEAAEICLEGIKNHKINQYE